MKVNVGYTLGRPPHCNSDIVGIWLNPNIMLITPYSHYYRLGVPSGILNASHYAICGLARVCSLAPGLEARVCYRLPEPQRYVKYLPFGLLLRVSGYYLTYFWGPGNHLSGVMRPKFLRARTEATHKGRIKPNPKPKFLNPLYSKKHIPKPLNPRPTVQGQKSSQESFLETPLAVGFRV